jgi:flagellar hook-associated protein 3 FlgL
MRISTAGFHRGTIEALNSRSADLARTQEQIASGRRVNTPSDDPAAAVHILQLQRAIDESEQFGRNADTATNRLSFEETALADGTGILQRIRDLTVQANVGSLSGSDREAIAVELDAQYAALIDLGNMRDATGEYLFSGTATFTQPFASAGGVVSYAGDANTRALQITSSQRVTDGHTGRDVFMQITEGNGTFTAALGANNGSLSIQTAADIDTSAWVPDTYTITFTSETDYEVTNSGGTVITNGTYESGDTITFNGAQVALNGTPAIGDTVTLSPASTEDIFTTVDRLRDALRAPANTSAEKALLTSTLGATLTQLDNGLSHFSDVRAEVGARLNVIEQTQSNREDLKVTLESTLSDLRDLDYAEAVSRLTLQQTGLEAAQAAYTRLAQLSLFDYL